MKMDSELVTFIKRIGNEAAKQLADRYEKPKIITAKSTYADIVTESDKFIEDYLVNEIKKSYPSHKYDQNLIFRIIAEESSEGNIDYTDEPTWFIDPIDGFYESKIAKAAVVYSPPANLYFEAFKGQGSFLNGNRISVNPVKDLKDSLILTDWGGDRSDENINRKSNNMRNIVKSFRGIRTLGSAALHACQIASGNGDAFFEFGIHCWDYAAGVLIAEEAGAYCCSCDGKPVDLMARNILVASNKNLALELTKRIEMLNYARD